MVASDVAVGGNCDCIMGDAAAANDVADEGDEKGACTISWKCDVCEGVALAYLAPALACRAAWLMAPW